MPGHSSSLSLIDIDALNCLLPYLRRWAFLPCLMEAVHARMAAGLPSFVMSTLELMLASGWVCQMMQLLLTHLQTKC